MSVFFNKFAPELKTKLVIKNENREQEFQWHKDNKIGRKKTLKDNPH